MADEPKIDLDDETTAAADTPAETTADDELSDADTDKVAGGLHAVNF